MQTASIQVYIKKLSIGRFTSLHTSCYWFLKYCLVLQGLPVSRSSRVNQGIKQVGLFRL